MAEPYLDTRGIVLGELESSYGADPTLVAADAIASLQGKRVLSPKGNPLPRNELRPSPIPLLPSQGARMHEVELETYFKGGGTAGTTHNLADWIQASGLKETDNGATITYAPDITDGKSIRIGEYRAGQLWQASGVRFSEFVISGKSGEFWMAKFKGKGIYIATTDSAIISSPVLDTTAPIVFGTSGGSFALNGYSFILRAFELALKMKMADRPAGPSGSGNGYTGFSLTAYEAATVKITVELPSVADQDVAANWTSEDNAVLDMTVGGTAGNRFQIDMPRLRINSEPKYSEDGGLALVELELVASDSTDNAADDWLAIVAD